MHESALARQILEAVLTRARAGKASRVLAVRGWIAETESVSPDSLDFHFDAHSAGTAAEGARLELRLQWVEARCRACGQNYRPEHHVLLCPRCSSHDADLLGSTGMGIEEILVE